MVVSFLLLLAVGGLREVQARLPPKLLKVASGAGKALHARGYGYSVIPIPHKIVLQTNIARKEIHGPRPKRGKRPPRRPPPDYAASYQQFRPGRNRRPQPMREPPDYQEQELEEELEYDDQPYKEYEDFVAKHSELYVDGYNPRGKKRGRFRDDEGAFTENARPVYVRRPRPKVKKWAGSRRPTKLYSASISNLPRPSLPKDEDEQYEYEEEDRYRYRKEPSKTRTRQRYSGERYRQQRDETRGNNSYRKRTPLRNWNPDDFYHDRHYEDIQEKFKRASEYKKSAHKENRDHWGERIPENRWKNRAPTRNEWNIPVEEEEEERPNDQREKWTRNSYPEMQSHWQDYIQSNHKKETETIYSQESNDQQRWKEPTYNRQVQWKPEGTEAMPDIITSQNADQWKTNEKKHGVHQYSPVQTTESDDWVKEHSVGYEIEMEGGKRKRVDSKEMDVVYGQATGVTKPRIPDVGFGRGMELEEDKGAGWPIQGR